MLSVSFSYMTCNRIFAAVTSAVKDVSVCNICVYVTFSTFLIYFVQTIKYRNLRILELCPLIFIAVILVYSLRVF